MKRDFYVNKENLEEAKKVIRSLESLRFEYNPIDIGNKYDIKLSGEVKDLKVFQKYLDQCESKAEYLQKKLQNEVKEKKTERNLLKIVGALSAGGLASSLIEPINHLSENDFNLADELIYLNGFTALFLLITGLYSIKGIKSRNEEIKNLENKLNLTNKNAD